jgi:hypothetical protein
MSTVSPTTVQSITWKNKKPLLDLAAVTAYPLELKQGAKSPTVYVFMSPYKPEELKDVLSKIVAGYRRTKRDLEIENADNSVYASLFNDHFVRMSNATGTPDQQRRFFDNNPNLKPSVVEHTFGGLRSEPIEAEDSTEFDINVDATVLNAVVTHQPIYDEITDTIADIEMVHSYVQPTEAQYREYKASKRNRYLQKKNLWTVAENYNTLEKLYDATVQSISGALVSGIECRSDNKTAWIDSVPLWHKIWLVDKIFTDLVEKNV